MVRFYRLLSFAAILMWPMSAEAVEYTFSKVYTYSSQPYYYCWGAAINDNGLVALIDSSGIIATDGQTATTVAALAANSAELYQVISINNNGFVAYRYGNQVRASNGTTTKVIASTTLGGLPGSIAAFGNSSMSINDDGVVAFQARANGSSVWAVYVGDGTTGPTQIAWNLSVQPAINANGSVVYLSGTTVSFACSPTIWDGTGSLALPGESWLFRPDINDNGTAACIASVDGLMKIVIGDGVAPPTYIDGSLYDRFDYAIQIEGADIAGCAINNNGLVAFTASFEDTSGPSTAYKRGIFTGANPLTDSVIMSGDVLDGSTVESVWFSRNGLNNNGQIAFIAALSDGTQSAWIATPVPVPEPSIFAMLLVATSGFLLWKLRKA